MRKSTHLFLQPINRISDIYLRQNVPECLHGCTFRSVVYSAEEEIANATFWFEGAPRRVVTTTRNATVHTGKLISSGTSLCRFAQLENAFVFLEMDSSLTANLTWDTPSTVDRSSLQQTIVVEWTRTVSDFVQPLIVNRTQTFSSTLISHVIYILKS